MKKKLNFIIVLLAISSLAHSQSVVSNFRFYTDMQHYKVANVYDSTFVKCVEFDLGDTTAVAKIGFVLTDLQTGDQNKKEFNMAQLADKDLTVKNNGNRRKNKVTISLGYLHYDNKNYNVTIKTYDSSNNLLNSSDFTFSH